MDPACTVTYDCRELEAAEAEAETRKREERRRQERRNRDAFTALLRRHAAEGRLTARMRFKVRQVGQNLNASLTHILTLTQSATTAAAPCPLVAATMTSRACSIAVTSAMCLHQCAFEVVPMPGHMSSPCHCCATTHAGSSSSAPGWCAGRMCASRVMRPRHVLRHVPMLRTMPTPAAAGVL